MNQISAGWYPDPAAVPGIPAGLRWWDGQQWTEHVQAAPQAAPEATPQPPAVQPPIEQAPTGYGQQGVDPYGQQPGFREQYGQNHGPQFGEQYPPVSYPNAGYPNAYFAGVPSTPDGQPLAGWWSRVFATIIDGFLLLPITLLASFPFLGPVFDSFTKYIDDTVAATEQGLPAPTQTEFMSDVMGPLLAISVIGVLVNLIYTFGFLRWRSATPGKMVLGLQVRLRDQPGKLSFATIGQRWVVQNISTLVGLIPLVGSIGSLFGLLDSLWPLWDSKKQALHDKWAKTNVVRRIN
jgi:uncharacterized RDD family membrane protein YckC